MKKKIAFISTLEYLPWGGSEDLWSQVSLRLLQNFEIHANIQKWNPIPAHIENLIKKGVTVHFRDSFQSIGKRLINRLKSPLNPAGLYYSFLDSVKPDYVIISCGCYSEGLEWMFNCKIRNIKYEVIIHLADSSFWQNDNITFRLVDLYKNAQNISFVSKANKALTEKQLGCQLDNSSVVWNPVKLDYQIAIPYNKEDIPRIAFVGRFEPFHKGLDLLFEVISSSKWQERSIKFELYGEGLFTNSLTKLSEFYKLDNISFKSFTPIEEIWNSCHALILPSRMEGLPLVIVEAMLAGRPVIATNVGGNAEVIDDNINGFIAKNPSVSEIDEALERAWNRRNEWEEMGKLARAKMLEILPKDPVGDFCNRIIQNLEAN